MNKDEIFNSVTLYYLQNLSGREDFQESFEYGIKSTLEYLYEEGLIKKQTRTSQQNKALHKFFTIISEQLNEMGLEYYYFGLKGQELTMMYTPTIVKEFVWKPIQKALFDIDSTTKLDTKQMNDVIDVLTKFFGERGVDIVFPSIEALEKNN